MPNHVTNKITAPREVIKSMLDEDGLVDFNMIISRHKDLELNGANGVRGESESAAELMCREKPSDNELVERMAMVNRLRSSAINMDDESFEQFILMMRNKRKHGFYHMMDFARNAWGTKWNAYGQSEEYSNETIVSFQTAWSHPEPVIKALSLKFPEHEIIVIYADEDTGSNCGAYTIKGGKNISEDIAPNYNEQSKDEKRKWTKFAFELCNKDCDPIDYGYDSNWDCIEE